MLRAFNVAVRVAVLGLMSLPYAAAQPSSTPTTIDGAVQPEQIPDVVAVRLFLGALADDTPNPAMPSGTSQPVLHPSPRQGSLLLPIHLDAPDTTTLLQAVLV